MREQPQQSRERRSQRVGYDMDGVVCTDPEGVAAWLMRGVLFPLGLYWHQNNARLLHVPGPTSIIITGRLRADADRTRHWLQAHDIHVPVAYNPWTPRDAVRWKAVAITLTGVTHYVESDPAVAAELRRVLTEVEITCP